MYMKQEELDVRLVSLRESKEKTKLYRWEFMRYEGGIVDVGLSTGFRINRRHHTVTLILGAHYTTLRSQIVRRLLDYVVEAEFEVSDLGVVMDDEGGEVFLTTDMLGMMLSVGVGAMRGMIALRTSNTFLMHYPLPVYNIGTLVDNIVAAGETAMNCRD